MPRPSARFRILADDETRAAFDRVENGLQSIAKAGAALAGVGIAAGAVAAKAALSGDAIAKNAREAGFSARAFQEFTFAGSQLGLTASEMASNLTRFTKRIGEAANGVGQAGATYDQLGISITDANGKIRGSEDILQDVARAMQQLETDAERSAAAAALFGREGIRFGSALAGGPQVLSDLAADAHALGLVLSDELLNGAEAATDQLDRMKKIADAQATVFGAELFPVIISVGNAFAAAVPHMRDFFDFLDEDSELNAFGRVAEIDERVAELRNAIEKGGAVVAREAERRAAGAGGFLGTTTQGMFGSFRSDEMEAELTELLDERDAIIERVQGSRQATLIDQSALVGTGIGGDGEEAAERLRRKAEMEAEQERERTGRMVAAQDERFAQLRAQRLTAEGLDEEAENLRFEREMERLAEQRETLLESEYVTEERKAELREQFRTAEEDAQATHAAKLQDITKRRATAELRIDQEIARQRQQVAQSAAGAVLGALQGLFGQSQAVQLAMLAFEKGKAIADVVVLTQVGAARAIAELGPVLGPPAAAKIQASGTASIGIIAAQGIAEAASGALGGGSAGGFGSGGSGSFSSSSAQDVGFGSNAIPALGTERTQNAGALQLNVTINASGVIATDLESVADELSPLVTERIETAVRENDVLLIAPDSRNGQDLAAASAG